MLLEALRIVLGLALTLVLPGAALGALLWPWKPSGPWEWARRALLSVVLSLAVVVLATLPLVYGPWQLGGKGLFQGSATGAPVLEALLGGLTALFALGAWLRARRVPPFPGQDAEEQRQHARAEALARGEGSDDEAARDLYG